jgi:hypothetical protein
LKVGQLHKNNRIKIPVLKENFTKKPAVYKESGKKSSRGQKCSGSGTLHLFTGESHRGDYEIRTMFLHDKNKESG